MILLEYTRVEISANKPEYTFCDFMLCEITDEDIPHLIDLLSPNLYIKYVDLDRNPDLTKQGLKELQRALPKITFINVDCLKSIDQIFEESALTRSTPRRRLSLIFTFSDNADEVERANVVSCSLDSAGEVHEIEHPATGSCGILNK